MLRLRRTETGFRISVTLLLFMTAFMTVLATTSAKGDNAETTFTMKVTSLRTDLEYSSDLSNPASDKFASLKDNMCTEMVDLTKQLGNILECYVDDLESSNPGIKVTLMLTAALSGRPEREEFYEFAKAIIAAAADSSTWTCTAKDITFVPRERTQNMGMTIYSTRTDLNPDNYTAEETNATMCQDVENAVSSIVKVVSCSAANFGDASPGINATVTFMLEVKGGNADAKFISIAKAIISASSSDENWTLDEDNIYRFQVSSSGVIQMSRFLWLACILYSVWQLCKDHDLIKP